MQPVMQLRQLMGFFIDNLQYYLQADVLDSQWTRLVERIRESQNFEAIHAAHDEYLSTLTRHCFLYTQKISPKLEQMLELCLKFGALLNTLDPRELPAQRVADLRAVRAPRPRPRPRPRSRPLTRRGRTLSETPRCCSCYSAT
jgi:hypothetical protein